MPPAAPSGGGGEPARLLIQRRITEEVIQQQRICAADIQLLDGAAVQLQLEGAAVRIVLEFTETTVELAAEEFVCRSVLPLKHHKDSVMLRSAMAKYCASCETSFCA